MRIGRWILALSLAVTGLAPATPLAWSQTVANDAPADCSTGAIARQRAAFTKAYAAKDYAGALNAVDPLWRTCFADQRRDGVLTAQVENDFALALHHTGSDGECMGMLMTYSPGRARPTPEMLALPPALQKAIRYNFGLCKPFCDPDKGNYPDASCAWMRAEEQFDAMVESDFKARPCGFKAPKGAVALPGGSCLAVTPAKVAFDISTVDEHSPDEICPGLALYSPGGKQSALSVPRHSLLRARQFCCIDPKLAVDSGGRIEITPEENPPEDCLYGHRETVLQDVMRLDGRALVLLHRLHQID
ncbi:MAG: hypothetical protein JWP35_3098 [Caulobacter sp.]|nr:hypothetical protein [Caulobacter sp.]